MQLLRFPTLSAGIAKKKNAVHSVAVVVHRVGVFLRLSLTQKDTMTRQVTHILRT